MKILKLSVIVIIFCNFALTTSCQTKEQNVDSIVKECQSFLDKDNLEGASACFQKAILSNPANSKEISAAGQEAVFRKCLEFKNQKEFDKAIPCFEGIAEMNPEKANVYFLLAQSYFNYHEKKFTKRGYQDVEILNRAEKAVKTGLEIKPEDNPARVLYAQILETNTKLQEALEQYKILVKADPKSSLFWTSLGVIQQKLNQNAESITSLQKAVELEPGNTEALYFLGKYYENNDEINEAIETFEKLIKIDPNYPDAKQKLEYLKYLLTQKRKTPKIKAKSAGN